MKKWTVHTCTGWPIMIVQATTATEALEEAQRRLKRPMTPTIFVRPVKEAK